MYFTHTHLWELYLEKSSADEIDLSRKIQLVFCDFEIQWPSEISCQQLYLGKTVEYGRPVVLKPYLSLKYLILN